MRKALALLMLGVVLAAAPAFAQDQAVTTHVGGSFAVSADSTVDDTNFEKKDVGAGFDLSSKVGLTVGVSQGEAWTLDATLVADSALNPFGKATFTSPAVTVTAVKDVGSTFILSKVADPLDVLIINNPSDFDGADATVLRVESSALGPSILAQWDTVNGVSLHASYALAPATVGALVRPSIGDVTDKVNYKLAGYATVDLGLAKVSGAAGMDTASSSDNTAYGVKVQATPLEGTSVTASYAISNKNFGAGFGGNRTVVSLSGSTNLVAPFTVEAKYSRATYTQDKTYTVYYGSKTQHPTYNSDDTEPIAAGDLRSESAGVTVKYAVEPVEASVGFSTGRNLNTEAGSFKATQNPLTSISGSAKLALVPDKVSVSVDVVSESDKDRDIAAFTEGVATRDLVDLNGNRLDPSAVPYESAATYEELADAKYTLYRDRHKIWAASHLKVGAGVEYKASDALTLTPSFAYHTYNDLEAAYQVYDPTNGFYVDQARVSASGQVTAVEVGVAATYKLAENASLKFSVTKTSYSLPENVTLPEFDVTGSQTITLPTSTQTTKVSVGASLSF